jgi:hypothetical protein
MTFTFIFYCYRQNSDMHHLIPKHVRKICEIRYGFQTQEKEHTKYVITDVAGGNV